MASKRKTVRPVTHSVLAARLERVKQENRALRKTVHALMDRVERAMDDHGTPFFWFQAAAQLEEAIRLRTEQYETLNARLSNELQSRREIEQALTEAKQQA